jgi:hypothetical protein
MTNVLKGLLATVVAAAAVPFITAGAAGASTTQSVVVPCSARTTAAYFTNWGDESQYFLAPGGDFQSGDTYPWVATGGASTVSNGDPWNVMKVANPASASIPPGGAETSMTFCIASKETAIRFFYRSPGVPGSALLVYMQTANGTLSYINTLDINGGTPGWAVSPVIDLPNLRNSSGQENVTISFSPANNPASWQVDDVMVDPFASL